MLTVITHSSAPSVVLRGKRVLRDAVVAASGMAVALAGFTVESVSLIALAEGLVIVQGQTAITLEQQTHIRTMNEYNALNFFFSFLIYVSGTFARWKANIKEVKASNYHILKNVL